MWALSEFVSNYALSGGNLDPLFAISRNESILFSSFQVEEEAIAANHALWVSMVKRDTCRGTVVSYIEHQVAQQGTWWSPWYPVSCCLYTGLDPAGGDYSMTYEYTYTWSADAGLGLSTEGILKMLGGKLGFTLSASESHSETKTCHVPGNSVGQIWYQKFMSWGDLQKRHRVICSGGGSYVEAWSKYYRVNAPIKDTINIGCSTGQVNVQCDRGTCRQ